MSGLLYQATAKWDVPLMVTRGYPSLSFLHGSAEEIAACGKPVFIYYFGDHDPSGRDITRATEAGLREFAPDAEIHFERVAVTELQIKKFKLPTRPTKTTDSRSKGFAGESVEVDAIPSAELRRLAEFYIAKHLNEDELGKLELIEGQERETLDRILANLGAW